MSRTPKRGKPPGYEFWGRRKGAGYRGRFGKRLAAKGDRGEAALMIRAASLDEDDPEPAMYICPDCFDDAPPPFCLCYEPR